MNWEEMKILSERCRLIVTKALKCNLYDLETFRKAKENLDLLRILNLPLLIEAPRNESMRKVQSTSVSSKNLVLFQSIRVSLFEGIQYVKSF